MSQPIKTSYFEAVGNPVKCPNCQLTLTPGGPADSFVCGCPGGHWKRQGFSPKRQYLWFPGTPEGGCACPVNINQGRVDHRSGCAAGPAANGRPGKGP